MTVQYKFLNPVTNAISTNQMNFSIAVVPDTEATFPDGYQKLKAYLAENGIDKIPNANRPEIKPVKVYFTVNEEGSIVNEYLSKSSGDPKTDKILLEVIQKMPKWKPAHNRSGANVRQEFVFAVGNVGC